MISKAAKLYEDILSFENSALTLDIYDTSVELLMIIAASW